MKPTAKTLIAVMFGIACICRSFAGTDMKDGFVMKHDQVLVTMNGSTKVMADDMRLRDGVEIRTDGTVIIPGGGRTTLKEGDTLSFSGTLTRAANGKVEQVRPAE